MSTPLWSAKPCVSKEDPAPGVHLMRVGETVNRLSPAEARELGADLIIAANTSEAQWSEVQEHRIWRSVQNAGHLDCGEWSAQAPCTEITCSCGAVIPLEAS